MLVNYTILVVYAFCFTLSVSTRLLYKKTSPQTKVKRLPTIELSENVPIGRTVINLRESLATVADQHFTFEFLPSQEHENEEHDVTKYFLLDSHTGLIQTAKSLDAESLCMCHIQNEKCSLSFRVKARFVKRSNIQLINQ